MHAHNSKIVIAIGFTVFIAFVACFTYVGLSYVVTTNEKIEKLTDEQNIKTTLSDTMRLTAHEKLASLTLITNLTGSLEALSLKRIKEKTRLKSLDRKFSTLETKLRSLTQTENEKTLLEKQRKDNATAQIIQKKLIDLIFRNSKQAAQKLLLDSATPAQKNIIQSLDDLHQLQKNLYTQSIKTTTVSYQRSYLLFATLLGIIATIVGGIVGYLVIKRLSSIENILFKEKERYSLAVRGANDGLWDWNLGTNKIYLSARWKAMLGYEDHEMGDNPDEWIKRIHPDDSEQYMADLNTHLNGHSYYFENEQRLLHRDGTYHNFLIRGLAMRDEEGKSYRIAGSQSDITKTKQNDLRVKAILNNVFDAIITLDKNGYIETINHSAQKMFGYNSSEIMNSKFTTLLPDPYKKEYDQSICEENIFENSISENNASEKSSFVGVSHEIMGQRKRGRVFPIELNFSEIWLDGNRKYIVIARDISENKNKLNTSAYA